MKSFFSLFISLTGLNTNLYSAEAGMPQLDPKYWVSQAFWLILVFVILYISLSKFYLPKIKSNLDNRENKIKEDLENANKFKEQSEAKLKEYGLILDKAKKDLFSAEEKASQIKKEVIEKEIEKEILKAQKEISELKKNSISSIQNISENITANIIENISGDKLNESSVKSAVEEISKKNLSKYL